MNSFLRVILLVAALGTLPALAAPLTTGSGVVTQETRSIGSFEAIVLRGSIDVVARPGRSGSLELRGDDNILPLIETRVVSRDGTATLEISPKRGASFTTRSPLEITLAVDKLRALSTEGSGDVRLESIDTDALAIAVRGSSDITASGRAPKLSISIQGSGDVDAAGLGADDVSVAVAGSGNADVQARRTLTVSIAGSGDVSYRGDAVPTLQVAGSGRVTRKK